MASTLAPVGEPYHQILLFDYVHASDTTSPVPGHEYSFTLCTLAARDPALVPSTPHLTIITCSSDYTKRVYQGVRVKHTVKDLLAEKRSQQSTSPTFNGGTNPSQPAFVPVPAPHMLPSCYSLKRPFIHGTELSPSHYSNKPPTTEAYSLPLEGKPLTYDPSSMTNYLMQKDNYCLEPFGEYRSSTYPTAAGALFTPSPSSLIPAYSGDPAHVFLRESWEQPEADPGNQVEGFCTEVLAPVPTPFSSVISTSSEPGSPSQCRTSGRSTRLPSPQLYPLQSLEEAHYSAAYLHHQSYTGASYSTVSTDHTSRMPPLSIEEPDSTTPTHCWANDDTSSWSLYEFWKAF